MFYHYWFVYIAFTYLTVFYLYYYLLYTYLFLHAFTPSSVFHPPAFLTPSIKESLFVCFITLWQIQRLNVEHEEIKIHKATRPRGEVCH